MKKKFIQDISASSLQVIINQLLGTIIFLITSKFLDKASYGQLNWAVALITFTVTILYLRLDQLVVRKVAANEDASKVTMLFFGHVLLSGSVFYCILLSAYLLFPGFLYRHQLLPVIAISQLLIYFSMPFKLFANGKEQFGYLAAMSSVSNLIRSIWLTVIVIFSTLTLQDVLIIFTVGALAELVCCVYVANRWLDFRLTSRWRLKEYRLFLLESLPQAGGALLNACIARFDWVLLGLITTPVIIAEYSFAYKVYELSPLPMLIFAPVLLTRLTRHFKLNSEESIMDRQYAIGLLIRLEMILATFLPLLLNLIWTPLVDMLTNNKYGSVNVITFLILSCCIPFQYLINLLWSIHFARNRLRLIFKVTAITCVLIVTGDLLMIPLFNANGAAIVYLVATIIQYLLFLRSSVIGKMRESWLPLIACIAIALLSGFTAKYLFATSSTQLLYAVTVYTLLVITTGQIKRNDLNTLQEFMKPVPATMNALK